MDVGPDAPSPWAVVRTRRHDGGGEDCMCEFEAGGCTPVVQGYMPVTGDVSEGGDSVLDVAAGSWPLEEEYGRGRGGCDGGWETENRIGSALEDLHFCDD
jgi:hypothetical protein